MKTFSKLEIALLTAAFVAAAIAPALAQQSVKVPKIKNRDEAIKTCLELVRSHFPLDTQGAPGRTSAYQACMKQAGHRP